jgi:hypothetical protein
LLLSAVILFPGYAGAVSEKDFEVQTTENLINLCTAAPDDPLYHQAISFCHGYLVDAFHYYEAARSGPGDSSWFVYLIRHRLEMMHSPCLSNGSRLIHST